MQTLRLELTAPDRDVWAALLAGDCDGAAPGYPAEADLAVARLVVEGHWAVGEWGPWQIRERRSGLLIGGVGFKGAPREVDGIVEIGYGLAESARGQGFATEAVQALTAYGLGRGAATVVAQTDAGNVASERVLERCGFSLRERDTDSAWWILE